MGCRQLRSLSSSSLLANWFTLAALRFIIIIWLYSIDFTLTNGFESLIELPQSSSWPLTLNNITSNSTKTLYIDEFGAQGIAIADDTQLPQSSSWPLSLNNITSNSTTTLCIDDFGAKGNAIADDTQSFHDAWRIACSLKSPSEIVIPAGNTYLVRQIDFAGPCKSNVTLKVSGTILAPWDPDVWKGLDTHKWLYFHGVKNLTVEGGGTIDGNGWEWWARSCKTKHTNPCRHAPTAITFHRCKNLKFRSVLMVHSQQMHLAFTACSYIAVSHLQIFAPAKSPNTDGIHISASKSVHIHDTSVSTGDDCISIVSNSSKIEIRNITCGPGHGISIGSLGKECAWDDVHDVKVNGAFIFNTDNGVRIKTWQGGSGIARKIAFRNVWMENVANPIIVDQYYCDSPRPCDNKTTAVNIENISFIGIKGTSATEEAIVFQCSDTSPCRKLYLEDVQLVSYTGGITRSVCWEAYGSSSGLVYPPPCFSYDNSLSQNKGSFSLIQSI